MHKGSHKIKWTPMNGSPVTMHKLRFRICNKQGHSYQLIRIILNGKKLGIEIFPSWDRFSEENGNEI